MQMYQMVGGIKVIPLMQVKQNNQPMENYGCCPAPHCATCDSKPTAAKPQKEEVQSKQIVSKADNPQTTTTAVLYDTREAPTSAKIEYSSNEAAKPTPMHTIQPYQEKTQQHHSSKPTSAPKEMYVFPMVQTKFSGSYNTPSVSSVQIASIADKVAYQSKGKEIYFVKPTEPKAEPQTPSPKQEQTAHLKQEHLAQPKREDSLFSAFKAYVGAIGLVVSLAVATPALSQAPIASYNKLEQAVSHIKVETKAPKPSTIDTYVASQVQKGVHVPIVQEPSPNNAVLEKTSATSKPVVSLGQTVFSHIKVDAGAPKPSTIDTYVASHVQKGVNMPIVRQHYTNQVVLEKAAIVSKPAISLEQTATMAYQSAQKTQTTAPIHTIKQTNENNAYRLLPWLFGPKKSFETIERDVVEQEPKHDYAKNYSTEQKVYRASLKDQESDKETSVKNVAGKKEKTLTKNKVANPIIRETSVLMQQTPKKKASSKPANETAFKLNHTQENAVSRNITSERSRAELTIVLSSLTTPSLSRFGFNLGKS